MSLQDRAEALSTARQHVTAAATNARGYTDGAPFKARMDAIEQFARFLMGDPVSCEACGKEAFGAPE
ncbi:hypothetical protein [Actinomadura atramentaria]|uniref:hypothetical protein n=1 Tax=Actinomadura atramentaria TaxID=1990 RepID=UPI00039E3FD5|nr:hypothetical protein [Actinomadura atramentaria]